MDSLLYVGAAQDDDDDSDDQSDADGDEQRYVGDVGGPSTVRKHELDFAALQRAGYESVGNLKESATYKRLEEEQKETLAASAAEKEAQKAEQERLAAEAEKHRVSLNVLLHSCVGLSCWMVFSTVLSTAWIEQVIVCHLCSESLSAPNPMSPSPPCPSHIGGLAESQSH